MVENNDHEEKNQCKHTEAEGLANFRVGMSNSVSFKVWGKGAVTL